MNISLRYIDENDIEDIARLANDRDIAKTTATLPYPYTMSDAITWFDYVSSTEREHVFAIVNKKHFVGVIGLVHEIENNRAELGYWLGKQYWSKGFASAAVQMILGYAFTVLKVNKVYAQAFGTNTASHKVLEKNNFVLEGCLKEHVVRMGVTHDVLYYGLQKANYDS
ncbi:MAG: GNAT family N-acetyltransferase [Clostridia bacterium]|jgi:[ribosomal protein S5]-alanine N-acetyltransferase|nr:GNAT family N-acetyltransferase [Clostridia bacterium]MBT7122487.1 GNAT family N-acetyltransferase [Clostridia bacterium]